MLLAHIASGSTGDSRSGVMSAGLAFSQIPPGDLDIAVVGQLAATNLPFGDEFERGLVKMVGFEAPFRRGGLRKQNLEYPSGKSHHALIFTDTMSSSTSIRSPS